MEAATASAQHGWRRSRRVTDDRLVAAARTGDQAAFEAIYDRYHRELLAFCRHMLGSREEAEDALQHVFIAAYRQLSDRRRGLELRPWLFAVARNRCLSVLRARRESVPLEAVAEPAADGLLVAADVERREELREMLVDLRRLPDDQRAALLLAELGALSHAEIAGVLDVRKDKVKALVFQARESLMGWREARSTACRDVQQLLAGNDSARRRSRIRRHVELCPDCSRFNDEVRSQRKALALLLPVVPSVALRHQILSASIAGGTATATTVAGGAALGGATAGGLSSLGGSVAAKALVAVAVAGGAGGGGYAVQHELRTRSASHRPQPAESSATGAPTAPAGLHRGPVVHVPGVPVRRGPVEHGKGRGPATASGDRASANGQAHGQAGAADGNHGGSRTGRHATGAPGKADAARPARPGHAPRPTQPSQNARPDHPTRPSASNRPSLAPGDRATGTPQSSKPHPQRKTTVAAPPPQADTTSTTSTTPTVPLPSEP